MFQSGSRLPTVIRDIGFPLAHAVPYARRDMAYGFAGLKSSIFGRLPPPPQA
jgi:hypothetical protein